MNPMFETTEKDGLLYVSPLPKGHRLYAIRDFVLRLGRVIDRWLF